MGSTETGWMDRAACLGKAELFTVDDRKQSRDGLGKWAGYDRNAIKEARAICNSCPVFYQCEADASPEDFNWTVRAGRMPTAFNTVKIKVPRKEMPTEESLADVECSRGHVGKWFISRGSRVCRECQKEHKRNARRKQGIGERQLKTTCKNGHTGQYSMVRNKRTCLACARETAKRSRDKQKAERDKMPS